MTEKSNDEIRYPKRKRVRLEDYDYNSNGMYFITICTKNKEKLFGEIVGGSETEPPKMRLSETGQIVARQIQTINRVAHVKVIKYVVMPNHIHMILSVDSNEEKTTSPQSAMIPQTVGGFKRLCSKVIGMDVFQRSYHDHIIRDQKHFETIWNYIEDNPRRWKEDCFFVADE